MILDLVEKVHDLGCRFMQLTYNNQSLLATGCYEKIDSGVTNFGREVIKEMNRVGMLLTCLIQQKKVHLMQLN